MYAIPAQVRAAKVNTCNTHHGEAPAMLNEPCCNSHLYPLQNICEIGKSIRQDSHSSTSGSEFWPPALLLNTLRHAPRMIQTVPTLLPFQTFFIIISSEHRRTSGAVFTQPITPKCSASGWSTGGLVASSACCQSWHNQPGKLYN